MCRIKLVALVALAAVGLVLVGCSSPAPGLASNPLLTNTPMPTPTKTLLPPPTWTPTPVPQPLELTVLHTNDTLGYTEPCG